MRSICTALLLTTLIFSASAFGQLIFPDGSVQSTAAKDSGVTIVSNVTELRAAVANGGVIHLKSGMYALGSETLTLIQGTVLIGSSRDYFIGNLGCVIRGSGNPVISGADAVRIRDLVIDNSTSTNTTLVKVDGSDEMHLRDVRLVSWINTGSAGTNIGLQVINGGHVVLENCDLESLDDDGNVAVGGTYIGIKVIGESAEPNGSGVEFFNSRICAADETGRQNLIGVQAGNGTLVSGEQADFDALDSTIETEGGSSATALLVASDGEVSSRSGVLISDGNALFNAGTAWLFGTIFEGTRITTGTTYYTYCSSLSGAGPTPITNSISPSIP